MPDWKQAIRDWRALPPREQYRRSIIGIPQRTARSMAMEGDPVSLEVLEEQIERWCPKLFAPVPGATVARFALLDSPLPPVEDTLRVGEWFRQAVMSKAGKLLGSERIPPVFSGHDLPSGNSHGHAFYLPEDSNGDGRIDHVSVYVPDGIDQVCHRILLRLTRLWTRGGPSCRVMLESISNASELAQETALFGGGQNWVSVTPYLYPWHVKKNFSIEQQLGRECRERGLPEIAQLSRVPTINLNGVEKRTADFHRLRAKRSVTQPDMHGKFWHIQFKEPIQGPLALGFACHFGLGLFAPFHDA